MFMIESRVSTKCGRVSIQEPKFPMQTHHFLCSEAKISLRIVAHTFNLKNDNIKVQETPKKTQDSYQLTKLKNIMITSLTTRPLEILIASDLDK